MDDSESGGTIGRKKGKKARKGAVRKLAEEISKSQLESQSEAQGVEEPEDSPSTPPKSLEEGTEQSITVIYSKDIVTPTLRSGSETSFDKNAEKDRVFQLEAQLAQALAENAQLDDKYKGLLGRVASIRTTLTDRLNKDAEELQQTKGMVETLEEQNRVILCEKEAVEAVLKQTIAERKILAQEVQDLRQRFSVSQQNWSKEREEADIVQQRLKEELETTRKAGQDWEVLAMEESSVRRALEERASDIEDQYISQKALLEKEISIKAQQAAKLSDLQMALNDIQQTRKEELREIVESTQSQIEALVSEKTSLREELSAAEARSNHLSEEIQRMSHLESDVKEKTLLIGKLRHQGVILNEHLTKALRMIKRGDPQDNVDRQLVTNLFISFLGLPRGDQKRFEVLQLIANYLKWTDEDRETAGLSRPGGSGYPGPIPSRNIQSPLTLTHLSDSRDGNNSGENLAELWASFLQQQTEARPDGL
ncbi:hypothetical protein TWF569_011479 [Orbilia oligospora]|uniref:GRIP domain-containing protein n=1 Tax=Orbilia oligospora TaxID=2813651 RepID=A0A7C8J6Z6_ORBOL|nr:hypothetical protein TWF706_010694 [Orbilia oligospora]KAF3091087.1 hypothetical protein TWF102_008960 [Orbilia oligospora]KAF3097901.1 hypothetical protein TWF103_009283 [Orbilia oligospora]KAF3123448.1 hypothetical protein TWF703_000924 [Orbilia oligospora]KAF3131171.1 hypothetical protein TWF569_011479 [Orbilia oligospora]